MPRSDYDVNINIKTRDQTSGEAKKAAKGLEGLASAAKMVSVGFAAIKSAAVVAEMVKMGAAADRQEAALSNLAMAAGESGAGIVKAIQEASDFTIDRMTAMQAANRAMVMDVAKTPTEFERLTRVAVALGRAMGQDAAKSIDDFVTASARQSQMIADNLGLTVTVGQATERYAKANNLAADSMTDAQKKAAFLAMMLEEGEKKMAELGDQSLDTAGKLEQTSTAWEDTKTSVSQAFSALVDTTGVLDYISTGMRDWTADVEVFKDAMQNLAGASGRAKEETEELYTTSVRRFEEYSQAIRDSEQAQESAIISAREVANAVALAAATAGIDSQAAFNDYQQAIESAEEQQESFIISTLEMAKAERDAAVAAMETAEAHLGLASQYTQYQEGISDDAESFAEKREQIEKQHQEELAKIAQKGQGQRKKVDEEGVALDLRIDQGRLAKLLEKQAKFNADTTDLERAQTERSIRNLEENITEKTMLLQSSHDGYVVMKGQNVNSLLAEEDRQYQESISKLEQSQQEQEEAQKKSLGRMVLNHFNAWVEMNLAADGFTKEEAEFVSNMRQEISTEYGLVTDAAMQSMKEQEKRWKSTMAVMTGDASGFFNYFMQQFNALPSEKIIRIRTELFERPTDIPKGPNGGTTQGIQAPGNTTYNDTFNIYDGHAMAAINESRRRSRRLSIGRTM